MVAALTTTGATLSEIAARELAPRLRGALLTPGQEAFEEALIIWNAAGAERPALIVRAEDEFDVIAAVQFARGQELPLAVKAGGHSMAAYGLVEGGLVIDFSAMKSIRIDPVRRVARAQPGLTWAEYAAAAGQHGLATTSGDVGTVGIGGLTLGGGIGWMVRKYGLTIDHLEAVELVTADGRLIRASADEHADLFWALRGGGGNFGVATAFEFRLEPAPMILGGAVFYSERDGEEVLRAVADYAATAPDELTTITFLMPAPPAPFIPEERQGELSIAVLMCYTGDLAEGERVVAPLRNIAKPIADVVGPMPYSGMFVFTEEASIKGLYHDIRSMYLDEVTDETIATIMDYSRRSGSPAPCGQFRVLGGAMARVPAEATAFAHRDRRYMYSIFSIAPDAGTADAQRPWLESFWQALRPAAEGVYVNFVQREGEARVREAYRPATFERLQAIKRRYDPTNLFKRNQNIKPT